MSSYYSLTFILVFLPLTLAAYGVAPRSARGYVLLLASCVFVYSLSGVLIAYLIVTTIVAYACGRTMASLFAKRDALLAEGAENGRSVKRDCKRRTRLVLVTGLLVIVGILFVLKYAVFFWAVAQTFLKPFDIVLPQVTKTLRAPIGISFYTLMAVSYLVDVYRETIQADSNLGKIGLYLGFFPHIMEGPICRYGQTAQALWTGESLKRDNLYKGSLRILLGMAKKVVVADRLNAFISVVYESYQSFDGGIIAFTAVLYTLQLYCDFAGTMDAALGVAQMFGIEMPENFRQPFFSRTASEFWQRWHITLGAWFKDYVYYPIALSKKCKSLTKRARKLFGNRYGPILTSLFALLVVWLCNGLWHGAGTQYVLFGLYYFVVLAVGRLVEPLARSMALRFGINRECILYRVMQTARTLVVVFVGELLFRAKGCRVGLAMLAKAVRSVTLASFANGSVFTHGLDRADCLIVAVMVAFMLFEDVTKERGTGIVSYVSQRGVVLRWAVWVAAFMFIIVFGAYGPGYVPVDPMYAQF